MFPGALQKFQITACLPKLQSERPKSCVLVELNPWSVWQGQSAAKWSLQEALTVMSSDSPDSYFHIYDHEDIHRVLVAS